MAMRNMYTVASSSSSTTYGNVMVFLKELLKRSFPIGFLKDINLSSELAYVNMRRRLGRNTKNEMKKLERPYLSIMPSIQVPSGDMYLWDIPLTKNFDNMEFSLDAGALLPILTNKEDGYSLMFKLNRNQIQFEVVLTVDTLIQQVDIYNYLVNHLVWERPFVEKTSLEAMIPREIIKQMCILEHIDIDDESSNNIPVAMEKMNRHTRYPITYKMRNGTATDEFFMYYNAEVMVTYSDINLDGVNRRGFADDYYQLRFTATTEFNLPGAFMLLGNKPRPKILDVDMRSIEQNGYHDLIPLFTINNFYSRYPSEKNGFLFYMSSRFQTDCPPGKTVDTLNLEHIFEDRYIDVLRRYNGNNIPMNTLVDIILLRNGEEMCKDWEVRWDKMELKIFDADNTDTYCIVIYINNHLFNEEFIDETDRKNHDKSVYQM